MPLFPFLSDNNRDSAQVARLNYLRLSLITGNVPAAYVTGRALRGGAVPVVWVALLFTRE